MGARWVTFQWDGETMIPFGMRMRERADEEYTVGETYQLVPYEDRSAKSHSHYFAVLHELWQSLPESLREMSWAETEEHLRKFSLIKTGFYSVQEFPCNTPQEAKRWAARLTPMDEYSIVDVQGTMVRRFTAKSQSRNAMPGKGEFQESKQKVLDFVSDLIGLPKDAEQRKRQ